MMRMFTKTLALSLTVLGMTSTLSSGFAQEEPEAFRTAHEALVQLEELREVQDDLYETWAARGRVAGIRICQPPREGRACL